MTPGEFFSSRLAPFQSKDFRRFYAAQSLSWIGTWMQDMGKSWLVLSQFGRGKEMGMLLLASALPVASFSIMAGVFADRQNPRSILLVTQFSLFISALILSIFAYLGLLEFWHLAFIAIIEGLAVAFDAPAFQVILPRLVGRENLQQTLALNSSSFHLSRILGPALGGIVLAYCGVSMIFLFNAFSFLFVCYTIYHFKNKSHHAPPTNIVNTGDFREFLRFLWKNTFFARILVQFLLLMTFVFPHTFSTLRIFVTDRFHLDAKGFGLMLTGPGLGAFLGSTILVITKPTKPYSLYPYGLVGIILFGTSMLFCHSFWGMNILLTCYTLSLFLYLSSLIVSLQLMTETSLRGRLGALITLAFGAWAPAWSALWGWSCDNFGSAEVFSTTLICFLILSLLLLVFWDRFFPSSTHSSTG